MAIGPRPSAVRGMYGEQVSRELAVSSNEMKSDFKIYRVTSNIDDKMTYKVVPDAEPGRYKVKLFKNPKLPTLNTWGSLTIHSNSELAPEKIVQVNITTRGSIVVQPSTLNFGALIRGADPKGPEKSLTVFKLRPPARTEVRTWSTTSLPTWMSWFMEKRGHV